MKKYFMMLAAVASAMTISSCSSSNDDEINASDELVKMTFAVSAPGSTTTRAAISGDVNAEDPKVHWEEGDQLSVYAEGSFTPTTFTFEQIPNESYKNNAYFTGTIKKADKYYVLYPAQSGSSLGNASYNNQTVEVINATLPSIQHATKNSFDPQAAICAGASAAAPTTSAAVSMKHMCSFFKVTVPKACSSIVIKANTSSSWVFAGKLQILPSSSGSKVIGFLNGSESVQLLPQTGASSFDAGTYLIAVASSTSFPGLDITVNYTDGTSVNKKNDTEIQFTSGYIYNLGTAPEK